MATYSHVGFQITALDNLAAELHERMAEFQAPTPGRSTPGTTPGATNSLQVVVDSNASPETAHLRDVLFRLHFKLLDLTEIYQSACAPYHLWSLALYIIQFSQLDDAGRIAKLWRSIIYR